MLDLGPIKRWLAYTKPLGQPQYVPELVAEVERLRKENARLEAALEQAQADNVRLAQQWLRASGR